MEEKKEWKKKIPMWIKEGLFEEVTDDRGTRILGYVNCSDKVLDFIEQEIDRAREEGYEKGKDYQARLDRELYGMSFEQIKSGDFNLKTKEDLPSLIGFVEAELDKARKEGEIEVLTEIFQTCYQEDSKTLELVEEKLSKLTTK